VNNKIYVEISIPSIEKKYDLFIPKNRKIGEVVILINKAINEMTLGTFPILNNLCMVDKATGTIFDNNITVESSGIINSQELIIM